MKKGQGQLVAFVLLIGFTVVLGLMVGNWAIQQARRTSSTIVERGEIDMRCADVAIAPICESDKPKIKNTGYYTIKLKIDGRQLTSEISPKGTSQALSIDNTVIPFIEIEGKDYGCSNKAITIDETICS